MHNTAVRRITASALTFVAAAAISMGVSSEAWGKTSTEWEKRPATEKSTEWELQGTADAKSTAWERRATQADKSTEWELQGSSFIAKDSTEWE